MLDRRSGSKLARRCDIACTLTLADGADTDPETRARNDVRVPLLIVIASSMFSL